MHAILKVSAYAFALSLILLILNLFDIATFPISLVRVCGVVCLLSLFVMVLMRVWLITYRRKYPRKR